MLSKLRVQHYKSLFDTEVDLEPLTVFIGPNGSGKSNICEALAVLSDFLKNLINNTTGSSDILSSFSSSLKPISNNKTSIKSKFWHGKLDYFLFEISTLSKIDNSSTIEPKISSKLFIYLDYHKQAMSISGHSSNNEDRSIDSKHISDLRKFLIDNQYLNSPIDNALREISIYDFSPINLSNNTPSNAMERSGQGIAYALVDILHSNRESFDELENRFKQLVPNVKRILLPRNNSQSSDDIDEALLLSRQVTKIASRMLSKGNSQTTFSLELVDKYSDHHIPASDISDGTLRILAFLTALYQENTPSIICFEELENGVHPWLLGKMMELLKIVSTEGITGKPVQVLITTHSPLLLNYVEPHQVRAVELDEEGKTQVHSLPTDSVRFQKALEAYDGSLGELWFTNIFGGNPK